MLKKNLSPYHRLRLSRTHGRSVDEEDEVQHQRKGFEIGLHPKAGKRFDRCTGVLERTVTVFISMVLSHVLSD